MSKLTDTKRAYDQVTKLLDQEIRKRSGRTQDLEEFRKVVDVAFYLLGWGQFEYLVRKEAEALIDEASTTKTVEKHAWRHMKDSVKSLSVRKRLDLIFHTKEGTRVELDKDYDVRNEAAHDYKMLPLEARDVSAWLAKLESLIDKF